jgi:hypothetical protein
LINKSQLQESLGHLYFCRTLLGSLPPQPPTARGRVGAALVKAMRRMLFWFVPQVDAICAASIEMAERQIEALDALAGAITRTQSLVERTQHEIQSLRNQSAQPVTTAPDWATGSAKPLLSGDPQIRELQELRSAITDQQARAEALLWLESVKNRGRIDALIERMRKSEAAPKPAASAGGGRC